MSDRSLTIRQLLAHPAVRDFVSSEDEAGISESLGKSHRTPEDPLYIRILLGAGAWFAAVFLVLFLLAADILEGGSETIGFGFVFLVAAIVIAIARKITFLSQLSLALTFAGNGMVVVGVAIESDMNSFSAVVIAHAAVCAAVYPLCANSIYRFLAPTLLATLATVWIIEEEAFVLIHALIAAETLAAGVLLLRKTSPGRMLKPLVYSAAAMPAATLLILSHTQIEIWRTNFDQPMWPSSVLLAGGLAYLYLDLAGGLKRLGEPWMILAIVSTILLGAFTTPGILAAVGLLVAGYAFGDRILTIMSYIFLPLFLVIFYYALNIDLAHKSWVIGGSGAVLLAARRLAERCAPREESI